MRKNDEILNALHTLANAQEATTKVLVKMDKRIAALESGKPATKRATTRKAAAAPKKSAKPTDGMTATAAKRVYADALGRKGGTVSAWFAKAAKAKKTAFIDSLRKAGHVSTANYFASL